MHVSGSSVTLSATDLSAFSECTQKTALDLEVAFGELSRPGVNELERLLLEKRGFDHEARVLAHFRARARSVVTIGMAPGTDGASRVEAARKTEAAMASGADVIYQGALCHGQWLGRPDFLLKFPGSSRFGDYHYAVLDAKLAREAKARAVLQLCVYTDQLARLQDTLPEYCFIAPGGEPVELIRLRTADYLAYYRLTRERFQRFVQDPTASETYPEPVEHCGVCSWWKHCETRRRNDDHLSLVAGITTRQRDRLALSGIRRVTELAALDPSARVAGIGDAALARVREQARLQVLGRTRPKPLYELLLDAEPGTGLEALPLPTPGDSFLDLEGDAFVQEQGLEYLFGLLELGEAADHLPPAPDAPGAARYRAYWARDRAEEKLAFETLIDRILERRSRCPELHVFHFGHREPDALKRLSCRHRTREDGVDQLLREHVLVDLHSLLRRSLRASVEGYTLKQLEGLYGFERRTELRAAAQAMQWFGWLLETGEGRASEPELMQTIERYNEDDCFSTWKLRDWLEERRVEFEQLSGRVLTRPNFRAGHEPERPPSEAALLAASLTAGLAIDDGDDSPEQAARRLMAHLLDWHWREAKSGHWEYYRAEELPSDERLDDRTVLGELCFVSELPSIKRSRVCRYEFPEQEHGIRRLPKPIDPDTKKAVSEVLDIGSSHIDLKLAAGAPHPRALIPGRPIETKMHAARLLCIARSILEQGLDAREPFSAARDLLRRQAPRCGQAPGEPLVPPGMDTVEAIKRLALALDRSVLAVQGPPGSGKTHRAAEMIVALVRAGKKVGITANSHEVIRAVLSKAIELSRATGEPLRALHCGGDEQREAWGEVSFELSKDYREVRQRLDAGRLDVIGGTSWAWVSEHFSASLDVLVVDEAGQMSLANVLAVSAAASSLVLFGDPAQLDQPQKGVHPPGADRSALEHLLGDALTMPPDRGVFLPETRRLHPAICAFTSRVFYEDRLIALPELAGQRVEGPEPFNGSGLRFVPVTQRGNSNCSEEEVERIGTMLEQLLRGGARFHDSGGNARSLAAEDVLVVAPYNAQVAALKRRLPRAVPVGTVDKFQGKQAPIVIYSMTSASADDAPRGLEFLFSLNRFNVATSRARALVVLVASPELIRVRCKSPRQMQLVNALCTYLELSVSAPP